MNLTNESKDCLSRQSPDLLAHLCSYIDRIDLLQIRQMSRLFNKLVRERVSIMFVIRKEYNSCFRLIEMFNKVKLKLFMYYCDGFNDDKLYRMSKYIISLTLHNNKSNISDLGIQSLVNLTSLTLWNNHMITDVGLQSLVKLTSLNLTSNSTITDEGLQTLVNLTHLDLCDNNKITDKGLRTLRSLTILNLRLNRNITDAGLQYVVGLTELDLKANYTITDVGIQYLVALKTVVFDKAIGVDIRTVSQTCLQQLRDKGVSVLRHLS